MTDIVVEWASSGHQRLLDRYLLTLDEVSKETLEPIWFDTDHPTLWATLPQVRQFVETLRETNRTLPAGKRIRLVGGNEGVDWTKVRAAEDLAPYLYLGPERDRDLTGSLPLSAAQNSELDRRNSIRSDPQRTMRARFGGRDLWFRALRIKDEQT